VSESTPRKLVFAPGCFDSFEGTQEELDELIAAIKADFESGKIFENMEDFEDADLDEDLIDEVNSKLEFHAVGEARNKRLH
jgi:hypothetical protein